MDTKILFSAVFIVATVFLVYSIFRAIFTAFSKKSNIYLAVSLILFIVPLYMSINW